MIVTHVPLGLHSQWFSLSAVAQFAFFVHLKKKRNKTQTSIIAGLCFLWIMQQFYD